MAKATRDAYGEALAALGAVNKDIVVLDADLSGSTKTSTFKKVFPNRHFNVGIAEQNLMGVAAGLAACGKIPFASTFAVFATGRAFDQIRSSICYPKMNVKIAATHAGITVGEDGATHQANEDVAIMRSLPNMSVIVPADAAETKAVITWASQYKRAGIYPPGPGLKFQNFLMIPIRLRTARQKHCVRAVTCLSSPWES
jgi:transketolase